MGGEEIDLLYGVPAIAECLRLTHDQVYHLHKKGSLPTFKIDGKVCARRSSLVEWLAAKEKGGRPKGEGQ